jgi:hypothetical protein
MYFFWLLKLLQYFNLFGENLFDLFSIFFDLFSAPPPEKNARQVGVFAKYA